MNNFKDSELSLHLKEILEQLNIEISTEDKKSNEDYIISNIERKSLKSFRYTQQNTTPIGIHKRVRELRKTRSH